MRPPMPSFGQGPSMGTLAHQQQLQHHQPFSQPPKVVPVFIGSISGGISDSFLNDLLSVSGRWLVTPYLLKLIAM
jgi:RNA-binding protein 25